jgi:HEAT repeat protein
MTPFIIPLLSRPDVGAMAMAVLAAFGTRVSGQLGDALLDTEHFSPAVRRRLARVLTQGRSAFAASALVAALDDPEYDVRSQVLEGLEEIRRSGIELPVTRDTMVAAAMRELARTDCPPGKARAEHPLSLLGLALDPEAFRLAAKALASDDQKLRGTALEYLENVLPDPVRSRLLATLPVEGRSKSRRVERELLADLRRTLG